MPPAFDLSLYLVTDPRQTAARGLIQTVEQAVAGGVTMVQLRDPEAKGRRLVEQARALVALLRPLGVPLIVNDRVDVALASDADGVHLGQSDMAPADARALLGPGRILGLSVGTPEKFAVSDLAPVDYVGTGPVKATVTKSDADPVIGVAGLAAMRAIIALPMVAIGGIDAAFVGHAIRAGADGVAVVSAICAASDVASAARRLREEIASARA